MAAHCGGILFPMDVAAHRAAPVFDTKEDDAMPRPRRSFEAATSYHVTMRCNNQAFDLRRPQARKVILFCLARLRTKFFGQIR